MLFSVQSKSVQFISVQSHKAGFISAQYKTVRLLTVRCTLIKGLDSESVPQSGIAGYDYLLAIEVTHFSPLLQMIFVCREYTCPETGSGQNRVFQFGLDSLIRILYIPSSSVPLTEISDGEIQMEKCTFFRLDF